mmetsp:Transcript_19116/g.46920  ORF Transcript_19116/g.46920 Transcript_19116/m.46920 type:complete len:97 (+) Transcript_19116:447-737(+)
MLFASFDQGCWDTEKRAVVQFAVLEAPGVQRNGSIGQNLLDFGTDKIPFDKVVSHVQHVELCSPPLDSPGKMYRGEMKNCVLTRVAIGPPSLICDL